MYILLTITINNPLQLSQKSDKFANSFIPMSFRYWNYLPPSVFLTTFSRLWPGSTGIFDSDPNHKTYFFTMQGPILTSSSCIFLECNSNQYIKKLEVYIIFTFSIKIALHLVLHSISYSNNTSTLSVMIWNIPIFFLVSF